MRSSLEAARNWFAFAWRRRLRALQNALRRGSFAAERLDRDLPVAILEHRLPLYRRLAGVDPILFENKRRNLELAVARIDGVLLPPGKTFSLWKLVGPPSAARGYLEGLVLQRGRPARGVGGGLCQLANALFWLALHSELKVVERHHHSLDLFPDDHRRVPFGTGASIVYNFKDLRFANEGARRYQFRLRLTEDELVARLLADAEPESRFRVREAEHGFVQTPEGLYRRNLIVREVADASGRPLRTETMFRNFSKCQYSLQEAS